MWTCAGHFAALFGSLFTDKKNVFCDCCIWFETMSESDWQHGGLQLKQLALLHKRSALKFKGGGRHLQYVRLEHFGAVVSCKLHYVDGIRHTRMLP